MITVLRTPSDVAKTVEEEVKRYASLQRHSNIVSLLDVGLFFHKASPLKRLLQEQELGQPSLLPSIGLVFDLYESDVKQYLRNSNFRPGGMRHVIRHKEYCRGFAFHARERRVALRCEASQHLDEGGWPISRLLPATFAQASICWTGLRRDPGGAVPDSGVFLGGGERGGSTMTLERCTMQRRFAWPHGPLLKKPCWPCLRTARSLRCSCLGLGPGPSQELSQCPSGS